MTGAIRQFLRVASKLALLVLLVVAAIQLREWAISQLNPLLTPSTEPALHRAIMAAVTIYVLLMMLPFVPGVEIGLGMMVMFGPKIVPLVYGATVLALVLSFLLGRLAPQRAIVEFFETLRMGRAARLLRELENRDPTARLQFLFQNTRSRFIPFLLRNRFLALVVALNLPGNAVIGGGGGICLVAGFSRLFSFPKFFLSVAIAVLPLPLVVMLSES